MDDYRRLCELRWELDEAARKRRDAQARTRAYAADQAEAGDPENRERCRRLADRWAAKSGELLEREDALSKEFHQLDGDLRKKWKGRK